MLCFGCNWLKVLGTAGGGSGYCARSKARKRTDVEKVVIEMGGCRWRRNTGKIGGAIYAAQGCQLDIALTVFEGNYAQARKSVPPLYC